ncbi:IS66 family transposase [Thiothrix nivea]|uniref:Transposase n=1 Tax=Thiothrix nivea (strain ATCC 35100 / DSM 5205 / JP2) TaxID=870187 RepID=A0A656HEP0_THINJ|nr:IS66 family transposase [Thiothrix nivea]EIJ33659.1 transposase [Thiothrix nivea DSM 5205]
MPALAHPLPTTLDEAHQLIVRQQERIAGLEKQAARVVVLEQQVETLQKQLEELVAKLGSSSRNSSKPPSSDSPEQRAARPKRKGSGRPHGGQPGHPRHERALYPPEQVTRTEQYFPESTCACGGAVAVDWENPYRHQVTDIAPPPPPEVTEHQFYHGVCQSCGNQHHSQWPDWVPSGQMGAGVIAWMVVLAGQFRLSMRQTQLLLWEVWQVRFSTGAISKAQGQSIPWMGPLYRQVGEHVRGQAVCHADETRHYRGTDTYWLWALADNTVTYFMTHYSRGKAAADALLGSFTGYLVTDHFSGYGNVPPERRQLCWAHLIRHFRKMAGRCGGGGMVGKRLLLIACATVRTHHRWQQHPEGAARYRRRILRLRRSFQATLSLGEALDNCKRTRNQCKHLRKDEAMCWTFLKDTRIPLTNNRAERVIRPYVQWRKTSFASQSAQGDRFRPTVLTVLGTARQLGMDMATLMRYVCSQGLAHKPVAVRFPLGQVCTRKPLQMA